MSDLLVRGARTADGTPYDVVIAGGRIVEASGEWLGPRYDATGLTVLPGLLDLQVNGAAGIDLTLEPERLWEVAAALPAYGVTGFVPTVITSGPAARDRALATLHAGAPPGWCGAEPLGLHFEGPMIAPGRKGAHPEQWLRDPALDLVTGWSRDAGVMMATVAPELPRALEVVDALVACGVLVSVGHTDATPEQVRAAADHGARLLTHLGNAMPPLGGRAPGAVGAALADDRLTAGVIADGHHLHADTLATYWRALAPDRFLTVTDCTAALGIPDGTTRLGDHEVVLSEGAVRLVDGTLAGSATSLTGCLRVLRDATGCSLAEAVATCTTTAAGVLGLTDRGLVTAGSRGDLTLVDDDLTVVATVIGGRVVHDGGR